MPCWCKGKCPHAAAPAELLKAGKAGQAAAALRTALVKTPYCLESNLMLAGVLARGNHALEAEVHIDRAAHYGEAGQIARERAAVLRHQVNLEAAALAFHEAMQADPDNPKIWAGAIDAVEMSGKLDDAKTLADAAREKFPGNALVRRAAATVAASQGDAAGAIEILATAGEERLPIEWLDLGRYHESQGQHDVAWADWMTGKQLARDGLHHKYNRDFWARHFAALKEAADPRRAAFMRQAPPVTDGGPTPLFICGFPRSGTTLAETILSRHSAVLAGDELMGVHDVIEALPAWCRVRVAYPEAMLATSLGENADIPELLRDLYLKGARRRVGWQKVKGRAAPKYFTDKMPLNELHLPLIRMLFPTAPIFRMVRHPLDVMVSCMSHWMPHGGFYASSLEDCARHYLGVDDVYWHFNKYEITADHRWLPERVQYENLVEAPGHSTQAMLASVGLKFEAGTLAPHKNPRTARTLSYNQVRRPIHTASMGRWKNYRAQLAPAVEILRPILERDGYDC